MRNRHRNDLHVSFAAGASRDSSLSSFPRGVGCFLLPCAGAASEEEQLKLLECRPEHAAQRDYEGNLPLHVGAIAGASDRAVDSCIQAHPDGPGTRNDAGFLPYQVGPLPRTACTAAAAPASWQRSAGKSAT